MELEAIIGDTETAGLDGGVCDIALLGIDAQYNELWRDESLVDPERPISAGAQAIHGITDRDVWAAPTMAEYMALRTYPLMRSNLVFIGHNAHFDVRMITPQWFAATHTVLDTVPLARQLYPDSKNHKLQTLRDYLGLEGGTAHRAMGDVVTVLHLLQRIGQDFGYDLHYLVDLASKPMSLESYMPWGQYGPGGKLAASPKGTQIKDVPLPYIEYLMSGGNIEPKLAAVFKRRLATRS